MSRKDLIDLRRGTAAQWAAANPVLALGEPGWDTTNLTLKVGDGVNPWSTLPGMAGGAPSGPAGGSLAGTYPNPTLSAATLNALVANGAPGTTGLALLLAATAAAARGTLGLGSAALNNTADFQAASAILSTLVANGAPGAEGLALLLAATAAAARTTLGLGTAALNNTGDFDATGAAAAVAGSMQWGAYASGQYYTALLTNVSTFNYAQGTMRAIPFYVATQRTFDRVSVNVTVAGQAGAKVRVGIYSSTNGLPDNLVLDAGQLAADVVAAPTAVINQALSPGLYWLTGVPQACATTPPTCSVINGFSQIGNANPVNVLTGLALAYIGGTSPTGALPANFASGGASSGAALSVALRAA